MTYPRPPPRRLSLHSAIFSLRARRHLDRCHTRSNPLLASSGVGTILVVRLRSSPCLRNRLPGASGAVQPSAAVNTLRLVGRHAHRKGDSTEIAAQPATKPFGGRRMSNAACCPPRQVQELGSHMGSRQIGRKHEHPRSLQDVCAGQHKFERAASATDQHSVGSGFEPRGAHSARSPSVPGTALVQVTSRPLRICGSTP